VWAPTERLYLSQDFNELIARCRTDGIGMHGLEVFSPLGELLEVGFPEEGQGDLTWAAAVVRKWSEPGVGETLSYYAMPLGH
jgi:hypothetical protein